MLTEGWMVAMPTGTAPAATTPDAELQRDAALIRRWRSGDEQAFRMLYEAYRGPLLRFIARLLPNGADAAEIAQDTWLGFIHGRDRYVPSARFSTFLFGIAHRRIVDHWRRRSARTDPFDVGSGIDDCACEPAATADAMALAEALERAIDALPVAQREAFLLRAEGGLSLEDIARATGTGRETAKTRLRYAVAKLRQVLAQWS